MDDYFLMAEIEESPQIQIPLWVTVVYWEFLGVKL